MSTHIQATKTNTFKYRRKVPSQLKDYLQQREIVKTLGKNYTEATKKAEDYNRFITESIEIVSIGAIPFDVKMNLISDKLSPILTINNIEETKRDKYSQIVEDYIESLTVSTSEIRDRSYILFEVFPSAFQVILKNHNPQMITIEYTQLVKVRDLLQKLPKRNIEKYRRVPLRELVKGIHQGSISITNDETISTTTLNKYLKWLNALMTFAVRHKVIPYNSIASSFTIKRSSISREERKELTTEDLSIIEEHLQDSQLFPLIEIFKYTGMRLSELYKCVINEVDGVLCFNLKNPTGTPLKTLSSYRVIPIHNKLIGHVDGLWELLDRFSTSYISKRFKKDIDRLINDTNGKSLYSLRHTFATTLIAKEVQPEIVSELMGHAHSNMTMNRYVKGYPIKALKDAIDRL